MKLPLLTNRFVPGLLRKEFKGVTGHGEVLGPGCVAIRLAQFPVRIQDHVYQPQVP